MRDSTILSRRAFAALAVGGAVTPLVALNAASAGRLSQAALDGLAAAMRKHVESGALPGVVTLIAHGGDVNVVAEGVQDLDGKAPMRRDTIFRIASMPKPVTAAAAMILVEDGKLGLDEPVDKWLPELAEAKVLRAIDAKLDDTVPAKRAITLRDLLTLQFGTGAVMVFPPKYPIQAALADVGLAPGWDLVRVPPDEFMKRLGSLPLVHQPGEVWLYHTGIDAAGVLIARAAGTSLGDFMSERIFAPLGMKDTGFFVPEDKIERLAGFYMPGESDGLSLVDKAEGGLFSRPPAFEAGGGGLVSTVDDYLAFCRMMLGKGRLGTTKILSEASVVEMTKDQISAEVKARSPFFPGFWDDRGWGLGMSVITKGEGIGRFGWDGGYGTSGYADPGNDLVGIMLTQRAMTSPEPTEFYKDFWTFAYQAIAANQPRKS
jgi:CubicO group peptidase (beta-lactamase class C family)